MSTWVPVIAAVVAAAAAVIVPWLTFRHSTRQDYIKWHRDQPAQLYVDLLVEAQAEKQHMQYETARAANPDTPGIGAGWYTDLRMPPDKRAELGARTAMFASRKVVAGVHPKVVQERLGHANISITLDTYSHVVPTKQRAAADSFAAAVYG